MQARMIKDEIDILYATSNKLTQSSTPAEWLEAVSDYARDNGATSGVLFYFRENAQGEPEWLEIAAEWVTGQGKSGGVRTRLYIPDYIGFIRVWMAMPDRPTLIPDTLISDLVDPATKALFTKYQMLGTAVLPLNIKGRWLGALMFSWNVPYIFDERDQRIFTAIIQQAAPVIDSMWLYDQSRERAARAERLLRVNTALSQATSEAEIVAAVALYSDQQRPMSLTLSYLGTDQDGHPTAAINMAVWKNGEIRLDDPSLNQTYLLSDFGIATLWTARPDEVLLIEDGMADPRVDETTRASMVHFEARAMAVIPLHSYGHWQGLIVILWSEAHIFTEEEKYIYQALLQTVPSVVASRRAYLAREEAHRESDLRAQELETVASVSAAAASNLDVHKLLDTVTELTHTRFKDYHILIYVLDEDGQSLTRSAHPVEGTGSTGVFEHNIALDDERSLIAYAGRTREGIIVNDIAATHDFTLVPLLPGMRSEMAVPMVVADRLVGVLDVQSMQAGRFHQADIRVMMTLADLIAVAVQNARLYEQAQAVAALEERTRLARELHDSVSQALYGIALGTRTSRVLLDRDPSKVPESLDYVLALAQAGLSEMRALIFELRPESLENEGLTTALATQATSLQARYHIEVKTQLCPEPDIPIEVKEALYRIAREALHNTVKHAKAQHVTLSVACSTDGVVLDILDDGVGFETDRLFPGHLGLKSMHERSTRLHGTLEIDSVPGSGTRVSVRIPSSSLAAVTS